MQLASGCVTGLSAVRFPDPDAGRWRRGFGQARAMAHDSYLRPMTRPPPSLPDRYQMSFTVSRASGSATRPGQAQNARIKQVRITIRSQRTAAQIG